MKAYLLPLLLFLAGCTTKSADPQPVTTPAVSPNRTFKVSAAWKVTLLDTMNLGIRIDSGLAGGPFTTLWQLRSRADSVALYTTTLREDVADYQERVVVAAIRTSDRLSDADFANGRMIRLRVYVNGKKTTELQVNLANYRSHGRLNTTNQRWAVNWKEGTYFSQLP